MTHRYVSAVPRRARKDLDPLDALLELLPPESHAAVTDAAKVTLAAVDATEAALADYQARLAERQELVEAFRRLVYAAAGRPIPTPAARVLGLTEGTFRAAHRRADDPVGARPYGEGP